MMVSGTMEHHACAPAFLAGLLRVAMIAEPLLCVQLVSEFFVGFLQGHWVTIFVLFAAQSAQTALPAKCLRPFWGLKAMQEGQWNTCLPRPVSFMVVSWITVSA